MLEYVTWQEFEVLHYAQLINTRRLAFPTAPQYPPARRAALTNRSKVVSLGIPPTQLHHRTKSEATFVSDLATLSAAGSTTGHVPVTQETPEEGGDNDSKPKSGGEKKEKEPEPESESEPLLFSVDDMVHVDEELGTALDNDTEALFVRDSRFLADLEDEASPSTEGAQGSWRHTRHLSRTSHSLKRLLVGE